MHEQIPNTEVLRVASRGFSSSVCASTKALSCAQTLVVFTISWLLSQASLALTMTPIDLMELSVNADSIAIANITGQTAMRDDRGFLRTQHQFSVVNVIAGQTLTQGEFETYGGVLDNDSMGILGMEDVAVGQQYLLFLSKRSGARSSHELTGGLQGANLIAVDSQSRTHFKNLGKHQFRPGDVLHDTSQKSTSDGSLEDFFARLRSLHARPRMKSQPSTGGILQTPTGPVPIRTLMEKVQLQLVSGRADLGPKSAQLTAKIGRKSFVRPLPFVMYQAPPNSPFSDIDGQEMYEWNSYYLVFQPAARSDSIYGYGVANPTLVIPAATPSGIYYLAARTSDLGAGETFPQNDIAWNTSAITVVSSSSPKKTMTEYLYAPLGYYFLTSRDNEKQSLDILPGWSRTGNSFIVLANSDASTKGIARYYFDKVARVSSRGSHFYTLVEAEQAALLALNPTNARTPGKPYSEGIDSFAYLPVLEGIGGKCASGQTPLYRAFRGPVRFPDDANHRFTTDIALYNTLVSLGWDAEGVKACLPQ